jgi:uncharacterized BrkB/YihY/UPF0761 family membrane protein
MLSLCILTQTHKVSAGLHKAWGVQLQETSCPMIGLLLLLLLVVVGLVLLLLLLLLLLVVVVGLVVQPPLLLLLTLCKPATMPFILTQLTAMHLKSA